MIHFFKRDKKMKRFQLRWMGVILLICIFIGNVFASPETSIFPEKKLRIEGHAIFFNDMGEGKPIILIHGLFANKEQWHKLISELTRKHFRIIALDLPGYGKSLGFPLSDYSLDHEVILLHEFLMKLGLKKFNLAGNSMGGAIAALYTIKYPCEVLSLAFIGSPLGLQSPKQSETEELFAKGENPFVPTREKEVKRLLHLLFVKAPILSENKMKMMIDDDIKNKTRKNKIISIAINPNKKLLMHPMIISQPVLIVWGKEDRIFDKSGALVLHKNFPHSRLVMMDQVGHLPQVENANVTAKIYSEFLH